MKTLLKVLFSALFAIIVLALYLLVGMPKNVAVFLVIYVFLNMAMILILGPENPANKKPQ